MANKIKGDVTLTHNGRRYTLRLDMNALADFETATGLNAVEVMGGQLSISLMRSLMHAGLQAAHPEVTLREAGEILQTNAKALGQAIASAFPDVGPDEGNGETAPKPLR